MTYCIAASINEGLILVSDSRTMAGIDNDSNHSKIHVFATTDDRNIVLFCEGNRSTTHAVLEQWHRDKVKNAQTNMGDCEDSFAVRREVV